MPIKKAYTKVSSFFKNHPPLIVIWTSSIFSSTSGIWTSLKLSSKFCGILLSLFELEILVCLYFSMATVNINDINNITNIINTTNNFFVFSSFFF